MQSKEFIKNMYSQKNLVKILSILSFFMLILVLVIVLVTPAVDGYELSMYDAYPWYFWLFFIVANFLAIIIMVSGVFSERKTNQWILGFFVMLVGNLILLLLPLFRGYCFYGGAGCDIYSHLGWIRDIQTVGYFGDDNIYPIIHILTVTTSDLLGLFVTDVIKFVAAFFSVLYPIFMFLLARSISRNKVQTILITVFSLPLIFSFYHLTIHPAYFSFVFLPFFLYLYYKRISSKRKFEISILLLIMCFFVVFFHPLTTLFAIIIFLTFIVLAFLFKRSILLLKRIKINFKEKVNTNLLLILIISFFIWYISQGWGIRAIKSIFNDLLYGSDYTIVGEYLSALNVANLSFDQIIILFSLRYGAILIFAAIAFLFIVLIGRQFLVSRQVGEMEFSYTIQIMIMFFLSIVMIVGNFIITNPIRAFMFFIMMVTIFNGVVVHSILNNVQKEDGLFSHIRKNHVYVNRIYKIGSNAKIIVFASVIFLVFMLCLCNLYPSPLTYEANRQFTYMDFTGSAWMVENRDITIQTSSDIGFNLERMEHYMNGVENGNLRIKKVPLNLPTHFGYLDNESVSQVFNNTATYLITTENGRQAVLAFPENVQQLVHQWTDEDFMKLHTDQSANKIYANKEFEVWKILGT